MDLLTNGYTNFLGKHLNSTFKIILFTAVFFVLTIFVGDQWVDKYGGIEGDSYMPLIGIFGVLIFYAYSIIGAVKNKK